MVEANKSLKYDEEAKEINGFFLKNEEIHILNGLLKKKIYNIIPFPLDEIEILEKGWNDEY